MPGYQATPEELAEASRELARQDAARGHGVTIDTVTGPKTFINYSRKASAEETFRSSFIAANLSDLMLVHVWGASQDDGSLPAKPRVPGHFENWLTSFKRKNGRPYFVFPPVKNIRGVYFNEGGRGITFTSTNWIPFRLYVAGWVLTKKGKWSLTRMK